MRTSRQRFMDTLDFKLVKNPWFRWGSYAWDETIEIWKKQGYDGCDLNDYFSLDVLLDVPPWYGPVPPFEYKVIEENEKFRTYINHEGILMKEFKEHSSSSMPQFIKFPVENAAEFEDFVATRLQLNAKQRCSQQWKEKISAGVKDDQWPRLCFADRWGGFFGSLRNLMGVENACCAFYDNPDLVSRIMEERADSIIAITEEVLKYTDFEVFWFWEDMAYNAGPIIGRELFGKFASPHYRRVCDCLRSKGIRHIGLDSDGDIRQLIPLWLDNGINMLWPFEVQAHMDVIEIRRQYGHDLVIMGGINKREITKGGDAMRREVDRVIPLIEDGGYIPELDHGVPPDTSWAVYCEYIDYLKLRLRSG